MQHFRNKCRRVRALLAVLAASIGGYFLPASFAGSAGIASLAGGIRSERGSQRIPRSFWYKSAPGGRAEPIPKAPSKETPHYTTGNSLYPPWPAGMEEAMFGMGCFWCSENIFMKMPGVYSTQVGYAGGNVANPTYTEVSTGHTGHNEVVRVIYDPKVVSYATLLKAFWERHNPTTLNRQGNDMGTQYRSGIYYYHEAQKRLAEETKTRFQKALEGSSSLAGRPIVTEIVPASEFFYAENQHQQYDAKPGSRQYCGLVPTGMKLDIAGLE